MPIKCPGACCDPETQKLLEFEPAQLLPHCATEHPTMPVSVLAEALGFEREESKTSRGVDLEFHVSLQDERIAAHDKIGSTLSALTQDHQQYGQQLQKLVESVMAHHTEVTGLLRSQVEAHHTDHDRLLEARTVLARQREALKR